MAVSQPLNTEKYAVVRFYIRKRIVQELDKEWGKGVGRVVDR